MTDLKTFDAKLTEFVRPQTFPLAIKMLTSEEQIPEKTKRPLKHLGKHVAICQSIGMARKYGWSIAIGKEDMQCALGAAPFGFFKNLDHFNAGNMANGMFCESQECGQQKEAAFDRFDYGTYSHILIAPLARANFEADVVLIYGNPAQIMRLIHGAVFESGTSVSSTSMGRLGCAMMINVMKTGECRYMVPGNGDRIFGMTQDDEMSFLLPASQIETMINGLSKSHRAGIRYPITSHLNFEGSFPPSYQEQMQIWRDSGEL